MKKLSIFLSIFVCYVIACMVIWPSTYISAALDGIKAWAFNVLPSVLPFVFFTKVLAEVGVEKAAKPFSKITNFFGCPPCAGFVFLMSMISGYPVGAKMTADLYQSEKVSKTQAFRMTSFCSTSGPMFIIGAVGTGMLLSAKAGYIIFVAHILGALANGLLYRKIGAKEAFKKDEAKKEEIKKINDKKIVQPLPQKNQAQNGQKQTLNDIVMDSALSILAVGTIITIFFVIIQSLLPLFNLAPAPLRGILSGIIEITRGCLDISASLPLKLATLACTFVISFGGISTILQSIAMLNRLQMPIKLFVAQKLTHALFATAIAALLVLTL